VKSKRVLLIRFSSLGDVVLTSALVDPLYKHRFEIELLTHTPYGELFKEDTRLKVIQVSKEELKKGFEKIVKSLKKGDYYGILDLHANLKSFLIKKLIPAEVKVSYNKHSFRRRICVFLNRFGWAEWLKNKPFNVLEAYTDTLKVFGIEEHRPRPKILLNEKRTEELLKSFNLSEGNYVVLGIGARYRKKEYPYFENLSKLLIKETGLKVVLVGDKKDYEKSKHWKEVINLCGRLELNESLHILKGARFYIGNDSGATHMARAVGTKVAVIYGGTHPCLGFSPYPDEGVVITKNLPCSPCDIHGKGKCGKNYSCLDIDPQEVLDRLRNNSFKKIM
jgi:ADP-heptose:LPS heptosyltransferase